MKDSENPTLNVAIIVGGYAPLLTAFRVPLR